MRSFGITIDSARKENKAMLMGFIRDAPATIFVPTCRNIPQQLASASLNPKARRPYETETPTAVMGTASRIALVALRVWQLICSIIVVGILARFLHVLSEAGATRDGRVIYGIIIASISIVFAIVFIAPLLYSFLPFPVDFALFIMWLVLFCLLITVSFPH